MIVKGVIGHQIFVHGEDMLHIRAVLLPCASYQATDDSQKCRNDQVKPKIEEVAIVYMWTT